MAWRLLQSDAELRVGIDDRSRSMGKELYLGYEMHAIRYKENNENNKYHGSKRERLMNDSRGGRGTCWTSDNPRFGGTDKVMARLRPQRAYTYDPPDRHQNQTEVLNIPKYQKFPLS